MKERLFIFGLDVGCLIEHLINIGVTNILLDYFLNLRTLGVRLADQEIFDNFIILEYLKTNYNIDENKWLQTWQ